MSVDFEAVVFLILAVATVGGAIGCVYGRRVAHSLLFLMLTFFGVAGIFVLASAEMLAAVQILVYLGSVMLVVQFGVMLTRRQIQEGDIVKIVSMRPKSKNKRWRVSEIVRESIKIG